MSIAKVSIENVNQFGQSVEKQHETTKTSIQNTNNQIEQLQTALQQEQVKAHQQKESLQVALDTIQNKILAQQEIVVQLESELSSLLASEPEEFETVWIPGDTDDEGNVISEGYWDEVETSEHIAWRNEVSSLEAQLSEEQGKLNHYQSLESQAQSVLSKIQEQIDLIQNVQNKLLSIQEELSQLLHKAEAQSQQCIEKLQQIQIVIEEYLSVSIAPLLVTNAGGSTQGFWSKIIYPNATVSGMSVTKFAVSRVPIMSKAFISSPQWIKNEVASYGNDVKVQDKPCRSHYTPSEKQIYMDPRYDDDEYAEVFKHEFGHYIDHAHGWASQSPAFVAAYQKDCENLDLATWDGARNTNNLLTELMNGESAKYDRCISDILSATYKNNPLIQNRYFSEGLSYYQHDNQYWDRGRNRENEVFANLFAIYSNNDTETIQFISKNFPNTDRVFRNLLS